MYGQTLDLDRRRTVHWLVLFSMYVGYDGSSPREYGRGACLQPRCARGLRKARLHPPLAAAVAYRCQTRNGSALRHDMPPAGWERHRVRNAVYRWTSVTSWVECQGVRPILTLDSAPVNCPAAHLPTFNTCRYAA